MLTPLPPRTTRLGPLEIRRLLPVRQRRLIGPWCFLDRYGPLSFTDEKPMDVAPHPHIGLQTVTWLLSGEVLHRDSLGSEAMIRPGQLNVMTSGKGISHAEETPRSHSGVLSGVQLWVALPDAARHRDPSFEHHAELPRMDVRGADVTLFIGGGSPASAYSPMVGAEARVREGTSLPLDGSFEHGVMLMEGDATADSVELEIDRLYHAAPGLDELPVETQRGARLMLLGGAPFGEQVYMWWNFVARSKEEIAAARADWEAHRFGEVIGYEGARIEAPQFPVPAEANPAS
ncbi:MAG TPA: pirin family protein [Thermoanaerobaculia bacterium]|nr:pirin family protein [Thermoanaerobaculia bacterium]